MDPPRGVNRFKDGCLQDSLGVQKTAFCATVHEVTQSSCKAPVRSRENTQTPSHLLQLSPVASAKVAGWQRQRQQQVHLDMGISVQIGLPCLITVLHASTGATLMKGGFMRDVRQRCLDVTPASIPLFHHKRASMQERVYVLIHNRGSPKGTPADRPTIFFKLH
jgi:hypothetical protein